MKNEPPPPPPGDDAGWASLARRIEADSDLRAALVAGGGDLRRPAVDLLAHLQALRDRLEALRLAARGAARLGGQATDNEERSPR